MRDSQNIEFLGFKSVNLEKIRSEVQGAGDLERGIKNDILEKLEEIIGPQEANWLEKNNNGRTADYIHHRYKFRFYPKLKKISPFPIHLLIEPVSFCNIQCVMCFQRDKFFKEKKNRGMIDFVFFKDLVNQAFENNCQALTLASRGEPSLHPRFGEMVQYCKGKFFELKININAVKLSERLCYQILDSGVDMAVFSVDSSNKEEYQGIRKGGRFDVVVDNIRRFHEIRNSKEQYSRTATRVSGVYLGYQDKKDFYKFWKGIVDIVVFVPVIDRWHVYENEPGGSSHPCNMLWERMYVWNDGTCNPCDVDYKSRLSVGNAKDMPLKDIWLGEKFSDLRDRHIKGNRALFLPCDRCGWY